MTIAKQIFAGKQYPKKIKDHKAFKTNKTIKKIFPQIGLPNCEKEVDLDNKNDKIVALTYLITDIKQSLNKRQYGLSKWADKKDIVNNRKVKIDNTKKLLKDVQAIVDGNINNLFIENNGKITVNLPKEVKDPISDKPLFKSGEGLFKVYNKINNALTENKFLPMSKLEDMTSFKKFSSINVPGQKYKVKFSSDGKEGVWDIATMSMRGISSCQSWSQHNSTSVVGSMLDPFTGIIYLQSINDNNPTKYGSKMLRRCIVRFAINNKTKKPSIIIERMYPAYDKPTMNLFKSFLSERTDNKFPISSNEEEQYQTAYNFYVPMSNIISELSTNYRPYRDSNIEYKEDLNMPSIKLRSDFNNKMLSVYSIIIDDFNQAINSIDTKNITKISQKAINSIKGLSYIDRSHIYFEKITNIFKTILSKSKLEKSKSLEENIKENLIKLSNIKLFTKLLSAIKSGNTTTFKLSDKLIKEIATLSSENILNSIKKEIDNVKIVKNNFKENNLDLPIYAELLN